MFEVIMHPDLSETYSSLEDATLEYLLKCWEKIRIDQFVEKDIQRQQDSLSRSGNHAF